MSQAQKYVLKAPTHWVVRGIQSRNTFKIPFKKCFASFTKSLGTCCVAEECSILPRCSHHRFHPTYGPGGWQQDVSPGSPLNPRGWRSTDRGRRIKRKVKTHLLVQPFSVAVGAGALKTCTRFSSACVSALPDIFKCYPDWFQSELDLNLKGKKYRRHEFWSLKCFSL